MTLLTALLACGEPPTSSPDFEGIGQDTDLSSEDLEGPIISHSGTSSPQYVGEDIAIDARIVDEQNKVLIAEIRFRRQTAETWSSAGMDYDVAEPESFLGSIPADELGSAGMHYYLVAVDSKNNESVFPEAAPDEFFKFDLAEAPE